MGVLSCSQKNYENACYLGRRFLLAFRLNIDSFFFSNVYEAFSVQSCGFIVRFCLGRSLCRSWVADVCRTGQGFCCKSKRVSRLSIWFVFFMRYCTMKSLGESFFNAYISWAVLTSLFCVFDVHRTVKNCLQNIISIMVSVWGEHWAHDPKRATLASVHRVMKVQNIETRFSSPFQRHHCFRWFKFTCNFRSFRASAYHAPSYNSGMPVRSFLRTGFHAFSHEPVEFTVRSNTSNSRNDVSFRVVTLKWLAQNHHEVVKLKYNNK